MKTLVMGCDASGKSTLVRAIYEKYGDYTVESSTAVEALAFKQANTGRVIDAPFINDREAFYLSLERAEQQAQASIKGNLITTNSLLITLLSHGAMRQCIGEPYTATHTIVDQWLNDETKNGVVPDIIVHVFAADAIIGQRIRERQRSGVVGEEFWGFNSPFFLSHYQRKLGKAADILALRGLNVLSVDTGQCKADFTFRQYAKFRDMC